MNIQQLNKDNCIGFYHKTGTDVGLTEEGDLASGYQHHDGLWWHGDAGEVQRPKTLELNSTINFLALVFVRMAKNLINNFHPKTILELGCGNGMLSKALRELDPTITTVTVDANRVVKEKSPYVNENHFLGRTDQALDFCYENGEKVKFDIVISLEHFEHVSEETFDTLMENVVAHTTVGSKFIFTAAEWSYENEDQKHVHCNCKSLEEWRKYITRYGFESYPPEFMLGRAGDTVEVFSVRK